MWPGSRSTKESRKPGGAKVESEEKIRSPEPDCPARILAPTRSMPHRGRSVAGLRNYEKRTASTAPWVGQQLKRIARTRSPPTYPQAARLVTRGPRWRAASRSDSERRPLHAFL